MRSTVLKWTIALLVMVISLNYVRLINAEQVYYPYPIVFVHGINSSDEMWKGMKNELRQYFAYGLTPEAIEEYKYPNQFSEWNYFIGCDYQNRNNGDIAQIAKNELKNSINTAISLYPSSIPENERKVIIVCHSMGGLVTRSLLTQIPSYKNKIYRVVFIDTPHLGSPYASALWLFKEITEDSKKNHNRELMYRSYSSFSPLALLYTNFIEYSFLYHQVCNTQDHIDALMVALESKGPRPSGTAIEQLRTPAFTYYEKVYPGFISSVTISKSYTGSETFLGQGNLDVPLDYKVIVGRNPYGLATKSWNIADIFNLSEPFTFSSLADEEQSLRNAIFNGDGIVTMSSQKLNKIDYQVNTFHVGAADAAINKVLKAIDDPPVIESVRFLSGLVYYLTSDYIIFKIKDYLLADVEVESLTVNGIDSLSTISSEYKVGNSYKPYLQYGKDFLKERYVTETEQNPYGQTVTTKLHLMPGEFYIKAKTSDILSGNRKISIKVKNPAQKTTECELYLSSDATAIKKSGSASGSTYPGPPSPVDTWEQVKQRAYDNFSASQKVAYSPYYGYFGTGIEPIGLYAVTEARSWLYMDKVYTSWNASLRMVYSHWLNFKLDTGNKMIKSVKFIGNLERSGTENFNISFYRDIQGPWPPNTDSTGDEFLFSLNTLSNNGKIEIDVNKTKINSNADNIWEFRPDFIEFNCIPDYIPPAVGETTWAFYSKGATINGGGGYSYPNRVPALMITFEENNP
ncbi:MAG: hypothetical protein Q8R05_02535 [Candidatus Omnitrophota bacterium]|nr:hypothetical protein [Candidatus Omnitrophota bacterium]